VKSGGYGFQFDVVWYIRIDNIYNSANAANLFELFLNGFYENRMLVRLCGNGIAFFIIGIYREPSSLTLSKLHATVIFCFAY
jgi:hypothetical protein